MQCFTDFSNLDGFATGTPGEASNEIANFIPQTASAEMSITDMSKFVLGIPKLLRLSECSTVVFHPLIDPWPPQPNLMMLGQKHGEV